MYVQLFRKTVDIRGAFQLANISGLISRGFPFQTDIIIIIIIIIIIVIIIMALPRRHFHRVALHPPGGPTALRPCPRTVW